MKYEHIAQMYNQKYYKNASIGSNYQTSFWKNSLDKFLTNFVYIEG